MTNKREKEVDICYVKRSLGNLGWISRNFFVNASKRSLRNLVGITPGPPWLSTPPAENKMRIVYNSNNNNNQEMP